MIQQLELGVGENRRIEELVELFARERATLSRNAQLAALIAFHRKFKDDLAELRQLMGATANGKSG